MCWKWDNEHSIKKKLNKIKLTKIGIMLWWQINPLNKLLVYSKYQSNETERMVFKKIMCVIRNKLVITYKYVCIYESSKCLKWIESVLRK